jgi:hypothetical protein
MVRYKDLVAATEAILFRIDPVGIGAGTGMPENEYASEAAAIVRLVPDAKDVAELERMIRRVFEHYFGEDTAGTGTDTRYGAIAQEIWSASLLFRTESPKR